MHNNQSSEDYLETILVLSKQKPVVRSMEMVEDLGYKKSSISVAMKNLRDRNHIEMSKEGFITLTPSGRQIAEMIYDRHQCLTKWLTALGVDPAVAAEDACQMEHVISQESFEAIQKPIAQVIEERK